VGIRGIRRKGETTLVAEKSACHGPARAWSARRLWRFSCVDGEQGVTQGDAQIAVPKSRPSSRHRHQQGDLPSLRRAMARDAATRKQIIQARSRRSHKRKNFDSGRLMFDYEKMISRQVRNF